VKWRPKLDRDGKQIMDCWLSDDGYTVALCRLPEKRYTITRPGGTAPFEYCADREAVQGVILADMAAINARGVA
jgi:hypothetical protein